MMSHHHHIYIYIYKYIYIYNFFILIYRRHVTASVCDIMWYRFLDMVWLFLLAISWESKEFAHPQLLEAMTSPEFRILRVLALSHDVLCECFFLALLNNGWTTDYPCKVERLETTLHQLKISLFWPLKMLGINSLPGFVFFYRKGFHLLCRRKPVKNPTVTTRSWDHCGRDGAFALRIHEGLVE